MRLFACNLVVSLICLGVSCVSFELGCGCLLCLFVVLFCLLVCLLFGCLFVVSGWVGLLLIVRFALHLSFV